MENNKTLSTANSDERLLKSCINDEGIPLIEKVAFSPLSMVQQQTNGSTITTSDATIITTTATTTATTTTTTSSTSLTTSIEGIDVNLIKATPIISATPINENNQHTSNNNNSMITSITGVGGGNGGDGNINNSNNRVASRRPQVNIISPSIESKVFMPPQLLSLTIHKDSNGYGMKVSGDNPVYVENVKPGGAAQKAGLIAGDMILKVNGQEVRLEKHTTVVSLIKSHVNVELTVKRSNKMQRPSSVGITPSTPILTRDRTASITGPQPVDNAKQRELDISKICTLQLMLEQEKKNLDTLKGNQNNPSYKRSETNIRKLQEQLRYVGGEDPATMHFLTTTTPSSTNILSPVSISNSHNLTPITPQPHQSSPAFLSLLPRSLSSLSLGTRKKSEKEILSPLNNSVMASTTDYVPSSQHGMSQSMHQRSTPLQQQFNQYPQQTQMIPNATPTKKKFSSSQKNLKEDIPPPLPQRNPPRNLNLDQSTGGQIAQQQQHSNNDWRRNVPISDLDHSMTSSIPSPKRNTPSPNASGQCKNIQSSVKKRPKTKTKALSDPKISTQMFLQMEKGTGIGDGDDNCIPPPLPPRQPGMMEEAQNILNSNKKLSNSNTGGGGGGVGARPSPNSIESLMNYPLVSTCTAVRDNMSAAFPFSQRPNIVQQLQQHQQNLHHHQLHHHHHHHNIPQPQPPSSSSSSSHNSTTKSSALGQTPQNLNNMNRHRRVVSSPEMMHPHHERQLDRNNKSTSGSWELIEKDNEITPPGTPPPPYPSSQNMSQSQTLIHGNDENDHMIFLDSSANSTMNSSSVHLNFPNQILAAQSNAIQKEIISMEDEEISDQECVVDEHGPFNSLQLLLETENVAHLAVFLNYVLSNSDPSPLLFYLITGLYKEGTVKDMRKWAYEIHSTFLVPCAPLMWFRADESLAREVDNVLQNEYDKVEILRKVFWKSRKKGKERICDQLREFQQKRTAGLGTIYGPSDLQLADAKGDKAKEQKIFDETLLPKLQHLVDELDKESPVEEPKKLALCSALSTVLHRIFITRSNPGSLIDRVHHFVSREKSFKTRLMGKTRKMVVRGHPLVLRQYYEVTHCNHCQTIIWGVSPQGYHCTDCNLNFHRPCSKVLEENCPGPVPQKRKEPHTDNKISKLMGKIRTSNNFIQNERRTRQDEESSTDDLFNAERLHSTSIVRQPSDRRPDVANASNNSSINASHNNSELQTSQSLDADTSALDAEKDTKRDRSKSKSAPVSVNRSESYKERLSHKRNRNNRRKTSDPSLSSKANDEQSELGLSGTNYSRSSSSSLSSGGSLEFANTLESSGNNGIAIGQHGQSINILNSGISGPMVTAQGTIPTPRQWVDSEDEEDNFTEVDWSSNVAADLLAALTDAEKKRQEIINEIYQTERSHVRTLRLLEGIFMRPLQEINVLPYDHLQLLFPPALLSLKDLHSSFEQKLKLRRIEHSHIVQNVGDLLAGMFEGQSGEELREYAAHFCARQQIALEALKEKRRKDENLQRFLTKAESHKACRRLQLKDLLPTVLQRLTKYPLLFENLYRITKRVTPDDDEEADAIQRALNSSKRILVDVNQAVKTAEDEHKLQTIQRRLDKSSFEKDASYDIKNLDLTQYKLIHDGHLTMKKNPGVQLHGLLFDSMMVLLHKQDDKYFLKNFQSSAGDIDKSKSVSPITYFDQQTLVRQSAADKNTFFLIITKTSQMLELRAPSSSECKTWFKHISDAAEHYKPRSKNSQDVVEDPASTTIPHSNTKESLESTPERLTATATATGVGTNSLPTSDSNISSNVDNNSVVTTNRSGGVDGTSVVGNSNGDGSARPRLGTNEGNNNDDDLLKSTENGKRINVPSITRNEEIRRDSSIYSNNSNNTRTLMQHSPLLEPSAIQISISPAHTAEPVLTPNERLKRLDNSIRDGLAEKQKIICDMFRVPIEHFNEIVDIVGLPEAPKDSSDIVLAAYAQVQSLTEVINEYMKITPEQEISAVSTSVCDQCHKLQQHFALPISSTTGLRSISPIPSSIASTITGATIIPNQNSSIPKAGPLTTPTPSNASTLNRDHSLDDEIIHEDDDGYCEIDELRLPSVQTASGHIITKSLPIGVAVELATAQAARTSGTPELIKRQSTISTDSIPEESEHDMMTQLDDHVSTASIILCKGRDDDSTSSDSHQRSNSCSIGGVGDSTDAINPPIGSDDHSKKSNDDSLSSEHIEINDSYDTMSSINRANSLSRNNSSCRQSPRTILCGPNRLAHCNSLEPTVPCSIINGFVSALNSQISLLLPKINERDLERERLRKENQHLRELLSAMHERQRVEDEKQTPEIAKSAKNAEKDKNSSESNIVDHKTELSSVPE